MGEYEKLCALLGDEEETTMDMDLGHATEPSTSSTHRNIFCDDVTSLAHDLENLVGFVLNLIRN